MTRSDRGDPRRGQGAVSEELGRVEGVGEAGRDRLGLRRLPAWSSMWSYAVTPLDQLRLGPPDQTSGLDLQVLLDVLDKISRVRIRQNFRVEARQCGL